MYTCIDVHTIKEERGKFKSPTPYILFHGGCLPLPQAHIVKTWSKLEHEDGNLALASHLALQYLNAVGGDDTEVSM